MHYADRVLKDSKEQAAEARDLGTAIHAKVQSAFEGGPPNESYLAVKQILDKAYGKQEWISEKSFSHPQGFGGKCDLHCKVAVIDIKTKAFGPQDDPQGFDEHLMQLAAYRSGLILPEAACANVFVSTTHAGLVSLYEWTKADVERGWLMFEVASDSSGRQKIIISSMSGSSWVDEWSDRLLTSGLNKPKIHSIATSLCKQTQEQKMQNDIANITAASVDTTRRIARPNRRPDQAG